ncbi:MAG TPA: hypothetical protein DEF30_00670 [Proteiniclasticum sp.]|nr:hypothetical protein [Proteiniclasticum sp.]
MGHQNKVFWQIQKCAAERLFFVAFFCLIQSVENTLKIFLNCKRKHGFLLLPSFRCDSIIKTFSCYGQLSLTEEQMKNVSVCAEKEQGELL